MTIETSSLIVCIYIIHPEGGFLWCSSF